MYTQYNCYCCTVSLLLSYMYNYNMHTYSVVVEYNDFGTWCDIVVISKLQLLGKNY